MDKIIIGIASIRSRRNSLKRVIENLRVQTVKPTKIIVYLNDYTYDEIPSYLKKDDIEVYTGDIYGDKGDAGKFFRIAEELGFYLSMDDDLDYPPKYIEHMINCIKKYERKYVIAMHGSILKFPVTNFFADRQIVNFKRHVRRDVKVHLPGTGVTAFHTDTLKLSVEDFPVPNMADIWFGLKAQEQGVGIVVVAHKARWIGVQPHTAQGSIFHSSVKNPEIVTRNTDYINNIDEWKLN